MRRTVTVGDIAAPEPRSIAIGPFGSALRADRYTSTGIPVVRGQNIGERWGLSTSDVVFVTTETAAEFPACVVRPGDLVFPHRGAIGRVARVDDQEWLLSSSMMKLTVDPTIADSRFVLLYFRDKGRDELLSRASTVGTPGIGQPLSSLRSIPISLPPLAEQQAIAEVLGALDDKIAANTALANQAESLAIAEGSAIEAVVQLGKIVDLQKNQVHPEALGRELVDHFSLPAFDSERLPSIESADRIKSSKFEIVGDAVLLSKLNPRFPRVWCAAPAGRRALASTEFLVLEPLGVSSQLLWAVLSQPTFSTALDARVTGTSGSHQRVKPADALAVEVRDPRILPISTRTGIEALLSVASVSRSENRTLAATRDALLPQLMSGKLRIRDAERIASEAGA